MAEIIWIPLYLFSVLIYKYSTGTNNHMANPFEVMVMNLRDLGFFGFLFPWILMFALTFGLLLKSKAVGEDKKILGVISMVVAFFVIGFGGPILGNFLTSVFGIATIVLAGL